MVKKKTRKFKPFDCEGPSQSSVGNRRSSSLNTSSDFSLDSESSSSKTNDCSIDSAIVQLGETNSAAFSADFQSKGKTLPPAVHIEDKIPESDSMVSKDEQRLGDQVNDSTRNQITEIETSVINELKDLSVSSVDKSVDLQDENVKEPFHMSAKRKNEPVERRIRRHERSAGTSNSKNVCRNDIYTANNYNKPRDSFYRKNEYYTSNKSSTKQEASKSDELNINIKTWPTAGPVSKRYAQPRVQSQSAQDTKNHNDTCEASDKSTVESHNISKDTTNTSANLNKLYNESSIEIHNTKEGTVNTSESWDDDFVDFHYKEKSQKNVPEFAVENSFSNLLKGHEITSGGLNADAEVFIPKKTDEACVWDTPLQSEGSESYHESSHQQKTQKPDHRKYSDQQWEQKRGRGKVLGQSDLNRRSPGHSPKLEYTDDAFFARDKSLKNKPSNIHEKSQKPSFVKHEEQQRRGFSLGSENRDQYQSWPHNKSDTDNKNHGSYPKRYSEGNDPKPKENTSFRKSYGDPKITRQNREFFERSENVDMEYKQFQDEKRRKVEIDFQVVKEIQHDLFTMSGEYSLAHCVAEDMRMGSGIAVNFRREFNDIDVLFSQKQKQGGLAVLEQNERYIYYLVTKRVSNGKPTYETLWSSLKMMRDHIKQHNVDKLAIPRLGCGLDRLEWSVVKHMIEFLFREVNVEITVCNFQQTEDSPEKPHTYSCKVVHVKKPIADIEEETSIIYLSSEDGQVSIEMEQLNKKYPFLGEFKRSPKKLGDLIKYKVPKRDYILNGCIVRKTKNDPFDFKSFAKCVVQINRDCRKEKYYYVAIQAIKDDDDDLINEKIITLLRNYLKNVEIYVCWDGDLVYQMPLTGRE